MMDHRVVALERTAGLAILTCQNRGLGGGAQDSETWLASLGTGPGPICAIQIPACLVAKRCTALRRLSDFY